MLPDSEMFLSMLRNKDKVLQSILRDIDVSNQNMVAFEKLEDLYGRDAKVNADKALQACAKSLRHVNDVNRRLLMLLLVYVSGGSYSGDTGKVLCKMGRGEEALKEMFRQKMNGA